METHNTEKERVLLAGLYTSGSESDFENSMLELKALAEACDMEVVGIFTQSLPSPNNATYLGKGKIEEIKEQIPLSEATLVIFDETLSPIQLRNLSDILGCGVLDRTALILRIFADRAKTKEATLQVELANLQYMLPRLVGLHTALSRQGGGSGSMSNKGTGEKKLELDRRHIENRINELKKNLEHVKKERATTRKQRLSSGIPYLALVGYTNAGKSTIMNWMLDSFGDREEKKVFEKDMLFATLDTTVRKINPGTGMQPFLLSDTVGFINKLPHGLVKAFHSTLEEVTFADLILHVVDASDPNYDKQMQVTNDTLAELGASAIPCLYVFNKSDKIMDNTKLPIIRENKIYLSAKEKIGMDGFLSLIAQCLSEGKKECEFLIPLERGDVLNHLFKQANIINYEYRADGIFCRCLCDEREQKTFEQYCVRNL